MAKEQDKSGKVGEQQGETFSFGKEHADALKLLPDLAKAVGTLQQGFKGLNEAVTALKGSGLDPSGKMKGAPKKEDDDGEEEDIDVLDNKGLVKHIEKRVKKVVEPALKRADDAEGAVHLRDLKEQVEKMASDHKDFWDWKEEMGALVKEHPDLSPRRLYSIARAENPKKAAEMDKKYAEKKEESDVPFGGLTPTSGRQRNAKRMNAADAAEAAWEATMSQFNIH